jgi:hypothetical protein
MTRPTAPKTPTAVVPMKLQALREELLLKAHLFSAEAKEEWMKLEKDWELLRSETRGFDPSATLERVRRSLERIRMGIGHNHASNRT